MDWLQYIVQGGAIVLLAVVLVGVWRIIRELLDRLLTLIQDQSDYINESIKVQQQLCDGLAHHEQRAQDRQAELIAVLKGMNGKI